MLSTYRKTLSLDSANNLFFFLLHTIHFVWWLISLIRRIGSEFPRILLAVFSETHLKRWRMLLYFFAIFIQILDKKRLFFYDSPIVPDKTTKINTKRSSDISGNAKWPADSPQPLKRNQPDDNLLNPIQPSPFHPTLCLGDRAYIRTPIWKEMSD